MQASDLLTSPEPVLKDWTMKRNCSVSPRQYVTFFASLALVSLAIAVLLWLNGAWLVLPFTGIELVIVGGAFTIHARHAVDYERIRLYPNRLVIEQMSADRLTLFEFNPRWVRVEPGASPRDPVVLASRGQTVAVGLHLTQEKRVQFARELRTWLARAC